MGFIQWLTEPFNETRRLAPPDIAQLGQPGASSAPSLALGADTFESLEEQRLAAVEHRRRCLIVGVPAALAVTGLAYGIFRVFGFDVPDAVLRTAFFGLFPSFLLVRLAADGGLYILRKTAKQRVLSVLAARQGLEYRMDGVDREILKPFKEQGVFGVKETSGETEDAFLGTVDGVEVVLFEALRETVSRSRDGSSSRTTVFHGLCLRLGFPKRFSGTTRVLSEWGVFNKFHEVGNDVPLERVRLEDARFEKQFEVLSSDQVEARYLLTPALMERLVAAQTVLGPRTRLRAAFHDRFLLLTLDTRKNRSRWARMRGKLERLHHFEIKDESKPVDEMEMTRHFEAELAISKDLVKTLQIRMETRI